MAHRFLFPLVLVSLALLQCAPVDAQTKSYSIGNSFTQDGFKFRNSSLDSGFELITAGEGLSHETANHVLFSSPLHRTLENPTSASIDPRSPYGMFTEALPGYEWDFVTLQPHYSGGATLESDQESIKTFIDLTRQNPANSDTAFYIYATWPNQSAGPYGEEWETASPNEPETPMRIRRAYYDNLLANVRSETDAVVYLIPTGEVFFELDRKITAGEVPGVSSISEFYRDNLHLDYNEGRYTAAMSIYGTLFKTSPIGVNRPESQYGSESASTPGLTQILQELAWDVISNDPNTGYADLNNDETVDGVDLALWDSGYGGSAPLARTGEDFLIWQRHLSPTPVAFAVPEPSTGLLCLLSFSSLLIALRRR